MLYVCVCVQNLHPDNLKIFKGLKVKVVNEQKEKAPDLSSVFRHLLICFHWFSQPQASSRMSVFVCAEICGEFLII